MAQGRKTSEPQKELFLAGIASGLTVVEAARKAGSSIPPLYELRHADAAFAAAWLDAKTRGEVAMLERLEIEADRRAVDGFDEPVFHEGKVVGKKRRYSDTLLIFRLKALAPKRYREGLEISGPGGGPIETVYRWADPPQVDDAG
jgi:hypothetical protein